MAHNFSPSTLHWWLCENVVNFFDFTVERDGGGAILVSGAKLCVIIVVIM